MRSVLFILITLFCLPAFSQNEIVISKDGEKITGEIKSLKQNVLTIETSYSDSDFKIDWEEVARVQSNENFRIQLSSGEVLEGSISSPEDSRIAITGEDQAIVELLDIVELNPIDKGFFNRLSLGLSAGYSFTKASSTQQLNVRTYAGYFTEKWDLNGNFSINYTTIDTTQTRRTDADLTYRYFVGRRWFAMFNIDWLSNTEQQLDLRTTTYLGFGSFLIRNYRMMLSLAAGGTYNNEQFTNESEIGNSSEAFVMLDYKAFNIGDVSINTSVTALPSLTEAERLRANFKLDFKWDLPKDFFINLGYTLNYDSKPPNDAPKDDYVFSTTLGWDL